MGCGRFVSGRKFPGVEPVGGVERQIPGRAAQLFKGEYWFAVQAAKRITGSPDLYGGQYRGYNSSINFLTCHDGFTLYDLYSYNEKHNEENGWNNTDGADDNRSWNCGYEGKSDNPGIEALRKE